MRYNGLMRHKLGRIQREVLSRLYVGEIVPRVVQGENYRSLNRAITSLYESRLVTERENRDGTVTIVLSNSGNTYALTANLDNMEVVRPKRWDRKWRVVLSDIPEHSKSARDALREHLKQLDFIEFQKSVWVHAYECQDQVQFLIEFYGVRRYVRYGIFDHIDNDLHLRKKFDLI